MKNRGSVALAALTGILFCATSPARAGGGPENVLLVVNDDSWASKAVANEYIRLRQVPPQNVLYLTCLRDFQVLEVDLFRRDVLKKVLDTIEQRRLTSQIDYVVYSCDLPTEIDQRAETAPDRLGTLPRSLLPAITPGASITGLTFLQELVMARDVRYVHLGANPYFRPFGERGGRVATSPAAAFHSQVRLGQEGSAAASQAGAGASRYFLSTMLSVTSGRGLSVRGAIHHLQRSVAADGTRPPGTVYFMRNGDIRSKVRDALFPSAVEALATLGVAARIEDGVLPARRRDVAGVTTGSAAFDWRLSESEILPGALCDNFTSWGGVMGDPAVAVLRETGQQTPLTEFLRNGAAGACGTVAEPKAVAQKFPSPFLQVFYASGCSLAEAFYQSVSGPYQLLIVGDPLCQPWARIPRVSAECQAEDGSAVSAGAKVRGKLTIRPAATFPPRPAASSQSAAARAGASLPGPAGASDEIARYELFVDGVRTAVCPAGGSLVLDTAGIEEGHHELRVVAVAKDEPQTQGRTVFPIVVSRGGPALEVTPPKEPGVNWDQPLALHAKLPGARQVGFYHNARLVGVFGGGEGEANIDLRAIGQGRVRIQPVGLLPGQDGNQRRILGAPIELEVRPPIPLMPPERPRADVDNGVLVVLADGRKLAVSSYSRDWVIACGPRNGEEFQVHAVFSVPDTDTYQFQLHTNVPLTMGLDGKAVPIVGPGNWKFIPVSLAKGTHTLLLRCRGIEGGPILDLRFGGPGSYNVVNTFKHVRVAGEQPLARGAR